MKRGMIDGKMKPGMSMQGMSMEGGSYRVFGLNMLLSLVIMYFVMFTMIYSLDEFYNNLNMFYMALIMAAPMGALMLFMMRSMFPNGRLNSILYAVFAAILVLAYSGVRSQALVGDNQFLRSMIPHHSGAILMCEQASIKDDKIKSLCANIIISQKREIEQMKQLLRAR